VHRYRKERITYINNREVLVLRSQIIQQSIWIRYCGSPWHNSFINCLQILHHPPACGGRSFFYRKQWSVTWRVWTFYYNTCLKRSFYNWTYAFFSLSFKWILSLMWPERREGSYRRGVIETGSTFFISPTSAVPFDHKCSGTSFISASSLSVRVKIDQNLLCCCHICPCKCTFGFACVVQFNGLVYAPSFSEYFIPGSTSSQSEFSSHAVTNTPKRLQ